MTQMNRAVPRARWWRIAVLLFLIFSIAFADRVNISVAAPAIADELRLGSTITGFLLACFFWGYAGMQIPGGWLAGRIGPKKVIVSTVTILALVTMAMALASGLSSLVVLRIFTGLAEGALWPSFAVVYLNWFPEKERGRAINSCELAVPLSALIMSPIAGVLIEAWDWRAMFVVMGAVTLVLGGLFWAFGSGDPAEDRWVSDAEREHVLATRVHGEAAEGGFRDVLANPRVWILGGLYFLWQAGFYAFGLWLPTAIKAASSAGIGAVGWLTAIPYLVAVLAMLLNSHLSERSRHSRGWFVAVPLLIGGAALLIAHYLHVGLTAQLVLLSITAAGLYSGLGPWWTWTLEHVHRNQAGPSLGLINVGGNLGGFTGPLIVGAISTSAASASGFYVLGFFALAAAAGIAFFIRGVSRTRALTLEGVA